MAFKLNGIFYGWWVVAAGFITMLLLGGFIALGFTAFFQPIADDFGWSYVQISLAASFRGIEVGVLAPLMGFLVDRWGPRRLVFGGIILIGAAMIFLSSVNSLAAFYAGFILVAIGVSGVSPTVFMSTVNNWFNVKLGRAVGVMSSGFASGGLLVPLVVSLIDGLGWRTALLILGLALWVVCLPLTMLLRHHPEQYGMLPDGEKSVVTEGDIRVPVKPGVVISSKDALRSRTFWHISLGMMLLFMGATTIIVHVMPYLASLGVHRGTASLAAMAFPLVSIAGRLGSGWLTERFSKRSVAATCVVLVVLGLLCLLYVSPEVMWLLVPFIILAGFGWGGAVTTRVSMISESFGRGNFGSIYGFVMFLTAIGGVIGPLFAGWVYDKWGSYNIAWLTLAVVIFAAAIAIATTPPVKLKARAAVQG